MSSKPVVVAIVTHTDTIRTLMRGQLRAMVMAGFDLVVGDGVLYASTAVNITENVLRAMEANFQAAGN
jgi:Skp family chaperone for outer membrane proteins